MSVKKPCCSCERQVLGIVKADEQNDWRYVDDISLSDFLPKQNYYAFTHGLGYSSNYILHIQCSAIYCQISCIFLLAVQRFIRCLSSKENPGARIKELIFSFLDRLAIGCQLGHEELVWNGLLVIIYAVSCQQI